MATETEARKERYEIAMQHQKEFERAIREIARSYEKGQRDQEGLNRIVNNYFDFLDKHFPGCEGVGFLLEGVNILNWMEWG